jgi:hypothetical protein
MKYILIIISVLILGCEKKSIEHINENNENLNYKIFQLERENEALIHLIVMNNKSICFKSIDSKSEIEYSKVLYTDNNKYIFYVRSEVKSIDSMKSSIVWQETYDSLYSLFKNKKIIKCKDVPK